MGSARFCRCQSFMLVFSLLGWVAGVAARDRPNVLLIVVDDLRFDDYSVAGHPFSRTPNIDRLDIAPTILDLAASKLLAGIDGRSVVPLFCSS